MKTNIISSNVWYILSISIILIGLSGCTPISQESELAHTKSISENNNTDTIDDLPTSIPTLPPPIPKSTTVDITNAPTFAPTATVLATPTSEPLIGPYEYPEQISPISGLYVEEKSKIHRRPFSIKISH